MPALAVPRSESRRLATYPAVPVGCVEPAVGGDRDCLVSDQRVGADQAEPPALDGLGREATGRRATGATTRMGAERHACAGRFGSPAADCRQGQRPWGRITAPGAGLCQIEFRDRVALAERAAASAIVIISGHSGLIASDTAILPSGPSGGLDRGTVSRFPGPVAWRVSRPSLFFIDARTFANRRCLLTQRCQHAPANLFEASSDT
jgi:hypothetical protein